jgi:hypothetical protein
LRLKGSDTSFLECHPSTVVPKIYIIVPALMDVNPVFLRNPQRSQLGEHSMRSYSKKMRPGREVILLTPIYYVFALRRET